MTADDFNLAKVYDEHHVCIRNMFHKQEVIWNGLLCDASVTEHRIAFKDGAKLFKLAPYQCGSDAHQPEVFKRKSTWIQRQHTSRIQMECSRPSYTLLRRLL